MKIALTYTGSAEKHNHYVRWLQSGDDITVQKIAVEDNNLHELETCDALVLSGGIDLHPELYHQPATYHQAPQDFAQERDRFETAAFHSAMEQKKPILGICRGLQLINCIFGGSLVQDLGALNNIHQAKDGDKAHGIRIAAGTLLQHLVKLERGVVNSAHHQAIHTLGAGLKINCRADDGTIEGVEWEEPSNKPFLLCVQWHPERMFQFQLEAAPLSKTIRDIFISEIRKAAK